MKRIENLLTIAKLAALPPYPSGTRLVFDQDVPPTGWVRDTTINDRVIRLTVGVPGEGGTWTISGLSASHTHEYTDFLSHSHPVSIGSHAHTHTCYYGPEGAVPGCFAGTVDTLNILLQATTPSVSVASSGVTPANTESSSPAISSDGLWRPAFRDVIVAQKE